VKFKILCLLAGTFTAHSICLAGFKAWELINERGRTNYVIEAEVTEPADYVTESGMYFVSRYMQQVEFFAGSEALPWILTDKSKGTFMLNLSTGNLYFLSNKGTRFDMTRTEPDTRPAWYFYELAMTQKEPQEQLLRTFLTEVIRITPGPEAAEDHLHVY